MRHAKAISANRPAPGCCRTRENDVCSIFVLSYSAAGDYSGSHREKPMLIIDAPIVAALAAVISSLSLLVWSVRRKP